MKVINPSTEEVIKSLEEDNRDSISHAYEQLTDGQKSWMSVPIEKRIECIINFKNLLLENIDSLAGVLTSEVGKPLNQSVNEINGAAGRIEYFIENSAKILSPRIVVNEPNLQEKVTFEPLGVVANISAWNYPYLVGVNVFIPALIAGNAVLYKPSEYSSLTGLAIQKLLLQAGIPKNVFWCIIGGSKAGQALLELPLDGYFFTGSYKTGQYIYEQVAKKMVPCQMELGGNDPLYVSHHNSDINAVAKAAAEGAFYNNGQSCCAVERIYVHREVYDEFINDFVNEVKTYAVGSSTDPNVFIGPLTRPQQLDVLASQTKDAVSKGAQLLLGGKRLDRKGYYFEPTVLTNVNHEMDVMMEESFGPIIGVQKVQDHQEAINLMLDTPYGLTAAVYTENKDEFYEIGAAMNSGTVYWNCCDRVSPHVPWSGRSYSGIGSTLGEEGIKAFVKPKSWQMRGFK